MAAKNANTDLPLLGILFLTAENANTDLPPIGFCILLLLGSKYACFWGKIKAQKY